MTDTEQQLLVLFRQCADGDRQALLAFAAFLASRNDDAAAVPPVAVAAAVERSPEPRPAQESVVMAIKRLARAYPMIDRRKLMGPTSLLISQHVLQGRAAAEVIDELEVVFERHCQESARRA